MTKSEIMKKLNERKAYSARLLETAEKSKSAEHVRAIGDTIEAIKSEILDLEVQLENAVPDEKNNSDEINQSVAPTELRNADILKAAYSTGNTQTEGLALRSNETMVSRVKADKATNLDIGKCIRGMYTGNWEGAEAEKREMDTSATGVIIPAVCSGQILDYARNTSLFAAAGVPVYPMTSNNLTLARVASDPTFAFKAEGENATETGFNIDSVELKAKTCYGIAYVSIEAIESAKNLTDIILQSFGQAMSVAIDKAMLYGQYNGTSFDSFAPAGIMNDTSINTITATNKGYSDYIKAIGAVRAANGDPTVLGMNAKTEELVSLMVDNNGQPLLAPKAYDSLTKIISNQLAYDESAGSDALVFDPRSLAIGVQNQLRFKMITDSDECLKKGLVAFQIYSMMDCKAIRPNHVAKITGIKEITEA